MLSWTCTQLSASITQARLTPGDTSALLAEELAWYMRYAPWLRHNICANGKDDQQTCHSLCHDDAHDEMSYAITAYMVLLELHGNLTGLHNRPQQHISVS